MTLWVGAEDQERCLSSRAHRSCPQWGLLHDVSKPLVLLTFSSLQVVSWHLGYTQESKNAGNWCAMARAWKQLCIVILAIQLLLAGTARSVAIDVNDTGECDHDELF
jgi:hypothetical protein